MGFSSNKFVVPLHRKKLSVKDKFLKKSNLPYAKSNFILKSPFKLWLNFFEVKLISFLVFIFYKNFLKESNLSI